MKKGTVVVLFLWLIIGAAAAGQRGYFSAPLPGLHRGRDDRADDHRGPAQLRRPGPDDLLYGPQAERFITALGTSRSEREKSFIPNGLGFSPRAWHRAQAGVPEDRFLWVVMWRHTVIISNKFRNKTVLVGARFPDGPGGRDAHAAHR